MVDGHEEEAPADVGRTAAVSGEAPAERPSGAGTTADEHAEMRSALDEIEAALDEAAATITSMG